MGKKQKKERNYFWIILIVGLIGVAVVSWLLGRWIGNYLAQVQKNRTMAAMAKKEIGNLPVPELREGNTGVEREGRDRLGQPSDEKQTAESETTPATATSSTEIATPQMAAPAQQGKLQEGETLLKEEGGVQEMPKQTIQTEQKAPQSVTGIIYRVQVGVFRTKENALEVKKEVEKSYGIPIFISEFEIDGGERLFLVQAGVFKDKGNAEKLANELRQKGYGTYISQVEEH